MTNLFEHTSAYWAKYAAYEWHKAANGKDFLMPAVNAAVSVYNISPLADQIVLDAVNVGLMVFRQSPERETKDAIHSFVCSYGLLGMMTARPTTPKFVEYEKVYLLKNLKLQFLTSQSEALARIRQSSNGIPCTV